MHDVWFAIAHHLAVFTLLGILVLELGYARRGMPVEHVVPLANIDRLYGAMSGVVIGIGVARAVYAAKGWDYYAHNAFFWAKMGAFAGVGLLSIAPSIRYVKWRRAGAAPGDDELRLVRCFLVAQLVLFAFIPAFAVLMARGYGSFG